MLTERGLVTVCFLQRPLTPCQQMNSVFLCNDFRTLILMVSAYMTCMGFISFSFIEEDWFLLNVFLWI